MSSGLMPFWHAARAARGRARGLLGPRQMFSHIRCKGSNYF